MKSTPNRGTDVRRSLPVQDEVSELAIDKLRATPAGLRYADLVGQLCSELPALPINVIGTRVTNLPEYSPERVEKPGRGFYRYRTPVDSRYDAGSTTGARTPTALGYAGIARLERRGSIQRIKAAAIEALRANPDGLHRSDLIQRLSPEALHASTVCILRTVSGLVKLAPNEVERPKQGFYRLRGLRKPSFNEDVADTGPLAAIAEKEFYAAFADWLVHETEECSRAIPLGGKVFGPKWGTPDVIGLLQKRRTDPMDFPPEIISAEIKTEDSMLVTAFGQACAYKLFSHKTYLVIPRTAGRDDIDRLDSLCLVLGIGLVLFDSTSPGKPEFEIRVRPAKHAPDMFYVNENMKRVPQLYD
jgi:hypothetical protein